MNFSEQYIDIILIIGGLLALFLGGEGLVRGAVGVAERLRIPKLLIGVTIVGFGTSLPELLVALQAARNGAPDIAVGNVIGSNIANLLLILCVAALICPVQVKGGGIRRDSLVMFAASVVLLWLGTTGVIGARTGMMMVGALVVYLLLTLILDRNTQGQAPAGKPMPVLQALVWIGGGLTLLIFGADFLVKGATAVARDFGVPDAVIGLTLVAVGTSLPELTISVISSLRRQNEVVIGNVLGSNVFNILGILGVTAWLHPLKIAPNFLTVDLPVMTGAAVLACLLVWRGKSIGRLAALAGLVLYGLYTAWLLSPGLLTG
jgi:cation:H+ antiporter